MKNYTLKTLKIFWQHALKHWPSFFVTVFSVIIASIGHIIAPLFYKDFFDVLTGPGSVESKPPMLIAILARILLVYLVAWVLWRVSGFASAGFESRVMAELANTCFANIHLHSVNFFNNSFVGSLVKKVNRFSRAFMSVADILFFEVLQLLTHIAFIIAILYHRDSRLGLAMLAWIVIFVVINYAFSKYKLKYDFRKSQVDSEVTGVLADTIANHQTVKLFGGYGREKKLFFETKDKWRRLQRFTWNLGSVMEAIQTLLMIGLEMGIFFLAVRLWQQGLFSVGDFVLIQAYVITVFHRLWNFGKIIRNYYENMAEANEMTEILETPHEIADVKNASTLEVAKGEIILDNVSFSYHKTGRVFFRLNLTFEARKKTALVGPSGAGKTSLVSILLRNYDLGGGKIYIDGQKISSVSLESLHQNIGLVPQDPILFHRSLLENIRYGRPEASDEEVFKASKLAYCHDFIAQFPEGYQTFVGERGVKLSGGERQRVAIARAILKNAPILILDEATSSLDSESEELIQKALIELMKDKTVIVIAHRLSTIMKMDRIVVLDRGVLVEEGSHEQLLKKPNGLYRRLWQKQVGGFIK